MLVLNFNVLLLLRFMFVVMYVLFFGVCMSVVVIVVFFVKKI